MSKGKVVAKVDEAQQEVSTNVMPDFMQGHEKTGLEQLDSSDFIMPIVKLMQATDEDVQTGNVGAGEFFHLTSKQTLGKEITFVPCHIRKRYMLFRPQDDNSSGTNILARADDGIHWTPPNASFDVKPKDSKKTVTYVTKPTVAESGLDRFGSSDPEDPQSRPAATLIYDVVVMLPDHPELSPAVLSLKGSAITKAKNFFTGIKGSKAPMYGLTFKAYGSLDKNGKNSYWAWNLRGDGFVKDKSLFDSAHDLHKVCSVQSFGVSHEEAPEADAPIKENSKY